ncbi:hypothetical protein D3C76_1845990 [compost metagenome]
MILNERDIRYPLSSGHPGKREFVGRVTQAGSDALGGDPATSANGEKTVDSIAGPVSPSAALYR